MLIVALHGRMSDAEFDAEYANLRATYGDSSVEAGARREQALAVLFYRSNWTQEDLAKKLGKTQQWVSYRVLFGKFLNFTTTVVNTEITPKNLTERRFRSYWEQTEGSNERGRFQAVLQLMREDAALRVTNKPKIGEAIVEKFADGKWHKEQTIANALGTSVAHITATMITMLSAKGSYGCKAEKKQVGTHFEYRLFKTDKTISSAELLEKLTPILEGLEEQGRRRNATMSVGAVAHLAFQLRNLLQEWTE
jgi:hypothetical protein